MTKQSGGDTVEYVLAKQVGDRAFFAKVTLVVSPSVDEAGLDITIDPTVDQRWHSAVSFGIEYGWERLGRERVDMPSVRVHVAAVEWQPSDTTLMTVAFAAANAIWKALKHRPAKEPQLDVASGSFIFSN